MDKFNDEEFWFGDMIIESARGFPLRPELFTKNLQSSW
jgi:hypothetical protein